MKKLLFLLALSFVQISFAQENNLRKIISNNSQNVKIRDNNNFQNVLYVIDGTPTFSDCSAINVQNIESINVIKGERATELYGYRAKNGVLIFTTKPNTQFLNFKNIVKEFKISKADQFLPIVLNKHFVDKKKYLLLDKSAIISVKILEEQPFVEPVLLPKGKAIYIETMETK
jgi:TonB-dependent SusC/RagA subfamily outer membrane receptor